MPDRFTGIVSCHIFDGRTELSAGTHRAAHKITLTNTGMAPLTISSVSLSGSNPGDFLVPADACAGSALQPGLCCTVIVRFAPSAAGGRSASLVFTENASNSPQSMLLNGSGA